MRKDFIVSAVLLLLTSCISNYNGDIPLPAKQQVVVNSTISPDRPVSVALRWSKIENENSHFDQVRNAVIRIWEDGELVIEETSENGYLISSVFPKHGSRYELKVTVPDYGELTAKTSIPVAPNGKMEFKETRRYAQDNEYYHHVRLSGIKLNSSSRALWLIARIQYEHEDNFSSPVYYYPDTYEIDQVNVTINSFNAAYTGSVVECEGFIRIPQDIVRKKDWLNLSFLAEPWIFFRNPPADSGGGKGELEQSYISQMAIDFIAPSDEYDRYCRSVYKQYYFRYDPDTPFLNENVVIQGNITNGLGVFAGYSVHRAVFIGYKDYFLNNFRQGL